MATEIGRELKVSELRPRTVVVLEKADVGAATVWVVEVGEVYVHFRAGVGRRELFLKRRGPDLEEVTDDTQALMKIYEFLGEP